LINKKSRPEDFPVFGSPDRQIFEQMLRKLQEHLRNLSVILKFDTSEISVSMRVMLEVIRLVQEPAGSLTSPAEFAADSGKFQYF
jgi:hypothetical protein